MAIDSIEEYELALQKYLNEDSNYVFKNSGIAHASAFTSTILSAATNLKMICRGLGPELANSPKYIEKFQTFLNKENSTLKIALETDDHLKNEPLLSIIKKVKESPKRFEIYKIKKEIIEEVIRITKEVFPHIMLADNKIFRFENIPSEYKAYGSFNDPKEYDKLNGFFEYVIANSDPIDLTA